MAKKTLDETIKLIVDTYPDCDAFIVGLPLLLSGEDSDTTIKARAFAKKLEEVSGKEVHLWDERLTSKQVEKSMIAGGVKRKKRTPHVDSLSATLILQNYLDRN
ncbi:MAG: putative pre-16S rRNA nuclease [Chlamydiia bacterium]|nr:putative pre-16S rRNA nuclease [Chlamydiia bacterium]MCH9615777.1 putative pre-16S rRNA nuclease [Chlamydiia bacterium]MCH9628820.1 putative pre-16S rRNA nuclease [Chlamydiia bacterium]